MQNPGNPALRRLFEASLQNQRITKMLGTYESCVVYSGLKTHTFFLSFSVVLIEKSRFFCRHCNYVSITKIRFTFIIVDNVAIYCMQLSSSVRVLVNVFTNDLLIVDCRLSFLTTAKKNIFFLKLTNIVYINNIAVIVYNIYACSF